MRRNRVLLLLSAVLLVPGIGLLGERAWLEVKAGLAARLIESALRTHLAEGGARRPWGWADTWPIARIEVPRLGIRRTLLEGASGSSLAFGLAHLSETAAPNAPGSCVVAGHRDSWASFLFALREGDRLLVESLAGRRRYRVEALLVVHETDESLLAPAPGRSLVLVTCYPARALGRGPWRYAVVCRDEGAPGTRADVPIRDKLGRPEPETADKGALWSPSAAISSHGYGPLQRTGPDTLPSASSGRRASIS